jgi:hypothetical protein
MIQRVQTLYLLLATILMSLTLFLPIGTIWQGETEFVIKAFSIADALGVKTQLPLYLGILLILPTLLPLITIFLYKKRMVQIRLCVSEIVLLVGAIAFIVLYCYRLCDVVGATMQNLNFTVGIASIMPILAVAPMIFAIRGIARDEALVRSLDRIR